MPELNSKPLFELSKIAHSFPLLGDSQTIQRFRQELYQVLEKNLSFLVRGEEGSEFLPLLSQLFTNSEALEFFNFSEETLSLKTLKDSLLNKESSKTILLENFEKLSLSLQSELLYELSQKKPRFIGLSSAPLEKLVEENLLKKELYYFCNTFELKIPPLRERKADLETLIQSLVDTLGLPVETPLSSPVLEKFLAYNWPENISELRLRVSKATQEAQRQNRNYLKLEDLDLVLQKTNWGHSETKKLKDAVHEFERQYIKKTLERHEGDKDLAAEELGLSLASLYRKIG